jgi:hypothetical protein
MDKQQHRDRVTAISDEGERRARAAGVAGAVSLNQYLTPEEQQQLGESLKSLDRGDPLPLPPGVSVEQVAV